MDVIPTLFSSVSILVSLYTFYVTQLRRAKLEIVAGPKVTVYYRPESEFCIYVPLSFLNSSYQSGVIHHVDLTVIKPGNKREYQMEWAAFARYNAEINRWLLEEVAHAVVVPGRSSIHKLAWFSWRPPDKASLILEAGEYELKVDIWTGAKPELTITSKHQLAVPAEIVQELEGYITRKEAITVNLRLDSTSEENRLLGQVEKNELLSP